MSNSTPLQRARQAYQPRLPSLLSDLAGLRAKMGERKTSDANFPKLGALPTVEFAPGDIQVRHPLKVGVVLSGGQAAGGHNVIAGLFDALKKFHSESSLCGFLNGPQGIIDNRACELTEEGLAPYRNQGGFDLIGSGRTKIETPEQFQAALNTVKERGLDGLVIIGGDDSNTNAALLAEYFVQEGVSTRVVGVPKTIDGDLKNENIEVSFGFDTACKTFSEIIGNIARDSLSAKKYYFFIKLMGRSASHIALECALQTHPNFTLIGEEVAAKKKTLQELTDEICDMISNRAEQGKNYGVILIPEGIIEFIPEFKVLIAELNRLEKEFKTPRDHLSPEALQCYDSLPEEMQAQLLLERDPHGNVQVSKIETERLFISAVKKELRKRKEAGHYQGKFSAQPLFCGYEGRSCLPSNFDCEYCYALGHVAALLIDGGFTGYMSSVYNLTRPTAEWKVAGIPLPSMITLEERKGKTTPVIKKALVDLQGKPFALFAEHRARWALEDDYCYPGPIQFFGAPEITDQITITLENERLATFSLPVFSKGDINKK